MEVERECGTMVVMVTPYGFENAARKSKRTDRGRKFVGGGEERWIEGEANTRTERTLATTQGLYFHNLPLCRF